MISTEGIQVAGEVTIKELWLIDTKNDNLKYNLQPMFVDIRIFEDILSPVLSGYIALIESQNLIETLPITGGEVVQLIFNVSGMRTISLNLYVTGIGAREHGDKKNAYTLNFISHAGFEDLNRKLSKSYSGNTSEIAKSVFKSEFGEDLKDVDQADNFIKFISPYWSPLKIMNYVTALSVYPNNKLVTPNYMFYQTCNGHKFKSLTTLFNKPTKDAFIFDKNPNRITSKDGTSVRDVGREYASIIDLDFHQSQNYIEQMMTGAYNHRVFGVDLFHKKVGMKSYSYKDDFYKTAHTEQNKSNNMSFSYSSGIHTLRNTCPNMYNGVDDISNEISAKRISLLSQMELHKLNILVYGRTTLEVGDTINILLNRFKSVDKTDKYSSDTSDMYQSGKYLITAIEHSIVQSKEKIVYHLNMQCIKDSYFSEITK